MVVNSVLSISQEDRAQQALEELQKAVLPHGSGPAGRQTDPHPGQRAGARGRHLSGGRGPGPRRRRLLSSSRLQTDESAITGESAPVEKDPDLVLDADAPLGDWVNMVLSGTLVTAGRGTALVCATGADSQMGRIAGMLSDQEEGTTPSRPGWRRSPKNCPSSACACAR